MIATGIEVLAALAPADAHILDLGGGTGALSSAVLAGLPGSRVTVLDVDADMLAEARRRLAGFGDRVSFQEASFLDPLPGADAVVASLALHHVHDLDTKTALYRAIHDALSPGGVLLNLDAAVSEGARLNGLVFDRMAVRMGDHGIGDAEAANISRPGRRRTATSRSTPSSARCARRGSTRSNASGGAGYAPSRAHCAHADRAHRPPTPEGTSVGTPWCPLMVGRPTVSRR